MSTVAPNPQPNGSANAGSPSPSQEQAQAMPPREDAPPEKSAPPQPRAPSRQSSEPSPQQSAPAPEPRAPARQEPAPAAQAVDAAAQASAPAAQAFAPAAQASGRATQAVATAAQEKLDVPVHGQTAPQSGVATSGLAPTSDGAPGAAFDGAPAASAAPGKLSIGGVEIDAAKKTQTIGSEEVSEPLADSYPLALDNIQGASAPGKLSIGGVEIDTTKKTQTIGSVEVSEPLADSYQLALDNFQGASAEDLALAFNGNADFEAADPARFKATVDTIKGLQADPSGLDLNRLAMAYAADGTLAEHQAAGDLDVLPQGVAGIYAKGDALVSQDLLGLDGGAHLDRFVAEEAFGEPLTKALEELGVGSALNDPGAAIGSVLSGSTLEEALSDEVQQTDASKAEALVGGEIVEGEAGWNPINQIPYANEVVDFLRDGARTLVDLAVDVGGMAEGAWNAFTSELTNAVEGIWNGLSDGYKAVSAGIMHAFNITADNAVRFADSLQRSGGNLIDGLVDAAKSFGEWTMKKIFEPIARKVREVLDPLINEFGAYANGIKDEFVQKVFEPLKNYATGSGLDGNVARYNGANSELEYDHTIRIDAVRPDTGSTSGFEADETGETYSKILNSGIVGDGIEQLSSIYGENAEKHREAFERGVFGMDLTDEQRESFASFVGDFAAAANKEGGASGADVQDLSRKYDINFGTFGSSNEDIPANGYFSLGGDFALADNIASMADGNILEQSTLAGTFLEELGHAGVAEAGIESPMAGDVGRRIVNYLEESRIVDAATGKDRIPDEELVRNANGAANLDTFILPDGTEANTKVKFRQGTYANSFVRFRGGVSFPVGSNVFSGNLTLDAITPEFNVNKMFKKSTPWQFEVHGGVSAGVKDVDEIAYGAASFGVTGKVAFDNLSGAKPIVSIQSYGGAAIGIPGTLEFTKFARRLGISVGAWTGGFVTADTSTGNATGGLYGSVHQASELSNNTFARLESAIGAAEPINLSITQLNRAGALVGLGNQPLSGGAKIIGSFGGE